MLPFVAPGQQTFSHSRRAVQGSEDQSHAGIASVSNDVAAFADRPHLARYHATRGVTPDGVVALLNLSSSGMSEFMERLCSSHAVACTAIYEYDKKNTLRARKAKHLA